MQKTNQNFNVNFDNIVISKISWKYSKYLGGHLDEVIGPLVLTLPKTIRYFKTFKDKSRDKNKNNKLMSLLIDDNKPLEKYKTIWTKIEDLKKLNWMLYQSMINKSQKYFS